jgi:hypothetical protein
MARTMVNRRGYKQRAGVNIERGEAVSAVCVSELRARDGVQRAWESLYSVHCTLYRVRSHAPSNQSHRGTKVV